MAGRHHHSDPQGKTLLLPPVKLFHLQFQRAIELLLKQHKMSVGNPMLVFFQSQPANLLLNNFIVLQDFLDI